MLITFASTLIISAVVIGFSYIFKIVFFDKKNRKIYNIDFIYGIFFICFFAIIANFFFPLKNIKILISIIGIVYFILSIIKKENYVNYFSLIFFIFAFSFFSYWNGNNADSPVYHIQTINWIHNYKITFGLAILDWHYALNSLWHIFLASQSYQFGDFNTLYVINFIPFSFLLSESINFKKFLKLSNLTLFFSSFFFLFFSFIHPFNNGIILNHLGNPEVDTMGMVFFILSGYVFLRYLENKNINDFYLIFIFSLICPLIKLTYAGSILFPFIAIIYSKFKIKLFSKKIATICLITSAFWSLRNLILNSCLVFPIKFTCINSPWALSDNQVTFYLNQTKSFSRDTPLRNKYMDFNHTIETFNWFSPWFKEYFLVDAFLKISFFLLFISIICCVVSYVKKVSLKLKNYFLFLIPMLIINLYLWFQAPEIRFGWGILIFFPCVFLSLFLIEQNIIKKINPKLFSGCIVLLCLLMIFKNFDNFKIKDLTRAFTKKYDYSNIKKVYETNNFDIYKSQNWMCGDFPNICINKLKKHYSISNIGTYLFIKTEDKETL